MRPVPQLIFCHAMNRTFSSLVWADRHSLHRVGTSARQPSHFLLLAQEKVTKEKGTPNPAAPAGLLCAARSSREVQKLALRAQTSELLDPSCPALLDASHGDPKSQHQRTARLAAPNVAVMSTLSTKAMRSEPWCIGLLGPLRRAEQRSGRWIKKRRCLSPYSGEFCASRLPRAAQGSPGTPGPRNRGRLFFAYFLLAKQKKVSALSGAYPDAVHRMANSAGRRPDAVQRTPNTLKHKQPKKAASRRPPATIRPHVPCPSRRPPAVILGPPDHRRARSLVWLPAKSRTAYLFRQPPKPLRLGVDLGCASQ